MNSEDILKYIQMNDCGVPMTIGDYLFWVGVAVAVAIISSATLYWWMEIR